MKNKKGVASIRIEYDQGDIIFQKSIEIDTKNVDELANKILEEEHKYYPIIIKQVLNA